MSHINKRDNLDAEFIKNYVFNILRQKRDIASLFIMISFWCERSHQDVKLVQFRKFKASHKLVHEKIFE